LPGSTMFDPAARDVAPALEASLAVWLDAFTQNVDRTPRNANLLLWHRKLYLIDHGAALFFHHNWATMQEKANSPFAEIGHHVLLPWATEIEAAAAVAHGKLCREEFTRIVDQVPEAWLESIPGEQTAVEKRAAYVEFFVRRLAVSTIFEEEAIRAHARLE